jgi:hypothetical protein
MRYLLVFGLILSFLKINAQSIVEVNGSNLKSSLHVDSAKKAGFTTKTAFFPTITFQNPSSPGTFGSIVFSGTYENRTRIANYPDANAAVYIGLGQPGKYIGAGITVNIYGVTNKFGEKNNLGQGSLSFHVNRLLLDNKLLLDGGLDNAVFWGGDKNSQQAYISYQKSFYLSGNYFFSFKSNDYQKSFSYLSITAGIGNGYYRKDKNYTTLKSGGFDPFFSMATPIVKGTNIIAEWNGYDVGLGLSIIPVQKIPFMLTLEVTDLVYGTPRFITSLSVPFSFHKTKIINQSGQRPAFVKPIRSVRTI